MFLEAAMLIGAVIPVVSRLWEGEEKEIVDS
jgi:hypothetical protein